MRYLNYIKEMSDNDILEFKELFDDYILWWVDEGIKYNWIKNNKMKNIPLRDDSWQGHYYGRSETFSRSALSMSNVIAFRISDINNKNDILDVAIEGVIKRLSHHYDIEVIGLFYYIGGNDGKSFVDPWVQYKLGEKIGESKFNSRKIFLKINKK